MSEITEAQAQLKDVRRLLYGLHTLIKAHFAKEEEIYLPLLDRQLSDGDAHHLLHKMAQLSHGEHKQGVR